jgi:hypothetical protein
MPTKESIENLSEWLQMTGADARYQPFDLRNLSNQAAIVSARELGSSADTHGEARDFLRQYPEVLAAVDSFRATSEALATHREESPEADEEDRRLDRERIAARSVLVTTLETATGRTFP